MISTLDGLRLQTETHECGTFQDDTVYKRFISFIDIISTEHLWLTCFP